MKNSFNPIFIGGCSRSGTTFLGSLLGGHEFCLCTPESQFKFEIIRTVDWKKDYDNSLRSYSSLLNNFRFKIWGINFNSHKYLNLSPSQIIINIVDQYSHMVKKNNYTYWIDHTPTNFRYVKELFKTFPEAKFIHIVRDGRAIANSIKNLNWGWFSPKSVSNLWLTELAYGFAARSILPEDKFFQIKYEKLIKSTDTVLMELCNFIGLEYSDNLCRGIGFNLPQYTKQQHTLVGKKAQESRINGWEKELSKRYLELFEFYSGNMLEILNYERVFKNPKSPILHEKIYYQGVQVIKTYIDKLVLKNRIKNL